MATDKNISILKLFFTFLYILLFPTLIIILSGDWFWIEAWIFGIWYTMLCGSVIVYLYRKNPALLAERYKKPGDGNQKGWDIFIVIALIIGFLSWIVIMPVDAKRYHFTNPFPLYVNGVGMVLLLISFIFFIRSFIDNSYLSALVRIQSERKQQVITNGVYGFVRHPMYLGALCMFIGTPLLLSSWGGFVVGLFLLTILMIRIIGEEHMLIEELDGYPEYKKKVRYRLIPYIW
jgi:protein-S-isoprenylcysteine O-methyltransferase Ste14